MEVRFLMKCMFLFDCYDGFNSVLMILEGVLIIDRHWREEVADDSVEVYHEKSRRRRCSKETH